MEFRLHQRRAAGEGDPRPRVPGKLREVRGYLARFRGSTAVPAPALAPPKARAVTAWIMTQPGRLADAEKASLDAILAASPELAPSPPASATSPSS